MALTPTKTLVAAASAVGASTALLPGVTGYGTLLFQLVALGAWGIVAAITSGAYADANHPWVWSVALVLNLALFLIPAFIIWLTGRKRWPVACSVTLGVWCAFYLASLFVLFPATDGP
jgi:hypothetical protein